jgi:hypothetical protein
MSGKKIFKFGLPLLVFLLLPLLAACVRQAQINNFVNLPVAGANSGPLAPDKVKSVILEACKNRGWVAREIAPGLISASLTARSHSAQIEIPYSGSSYSIIYKNSANLKYNAEKQTIHNQYNNWVIYLRQDIDVALAQR